MALTVAALRADEGGTEVVVATHEIRAGEVIAGADFRVDRIRARPRRPEHAGRRARALARSAARSRSRPSRENSVIRAARAAAAPRGAGLRAMSIPIDPALAVGGRLAAGDRVDVLFAGDRDGRRSSSRDAEVLAVDATGRGGIGETSSPFTVTIAVDAAAVAAVAAAIADGDISLARTTGAASSQGTAPQSLDRVEHGRRR